LTRAVYPLSPLGIDDRDAVSLMAAAVNPIARLITGIAEGAAMAFVITRSCCKDSSCVPVCPVDCIRPAGAPGEYTDSEMLYIDPDTCIDCGLCMEECPVDAIYSEDNLPQHLERFRDINAEYFKRHRLVSNIVDQSEIAAGDARFEYAASIRAINSAHD